MKLQTGVDLIEIERIREAVQRHGESFMRRIYTPGERALYEGNFPSLAARFAAKEAVAKALGTGIREFGFLDIEILRDEAGAPTLHLHGKAAELATKQGLGQWAISLSHTNEHAVAMAVAIG